MIQRLTLTFYINFHLIFQPFHIKFIFFSHANKIKLYLLRENLHQQGSRHTNTPIFSFQRHLFFPKRQTRVYFTEGRTFRNRSPSQQIKTFLFTFALFVPDSSPRTHPVSVSFDPSPLSGFQDGAPIIKLKRNVRDIKCFPCTANTSDGQTVVFFFILFVLFVSCMGEGRGRNSKGEFDA